MSELRVVYIEFGEEKGGGGGGGVVLLRLRFSEGI